MKTLGVGAVVLTVLVVLVELVEHQILVPAHSLKPQEVSVVLETHPEEQEV